MDAAYGQLYGNGNGAPAQATRLMVGPHCKSRIIRPTHVRNRRSSRRIRLIGHAQHDHRRGRCYLRGLTGDAMNVVLPAAGSNLAQLLRLLPCALRARLHHRNFALWLAVRRRRPMPVHA